MLQSFKYGLSRLNFLNTWPNFESAGRRTLTLDLALCSVSLNHADKIEYASDGSISQELSTFVACESHGTTFLRWLCVHTVSSHFFPNFCYKCGWSVSEYLILILYASPLLYLSFIIVRQWYLLLTIFVTILLWPDGTSAPWIDMLKYFGTKYQSCLILTTSMTLYAKFRRS